MDIDTFYNRIKLQCELPMANITYIVLNGNTYNFFAQSISLREVDKEKTMSELKKFTEIENFYAFSDSDKGQEFITKYQEEIKEGLYKSYFTFKGLGVVKINND